MIGIKYIQDTNYELLIKELWINTYEACAYNFFLDKIMSPFCDTNLMYDRKIFFVEIKNKLDGGSDGTDLYNDFKI